MKNVIKNSFYAGAGISLLALNNITNAAINAGDVTNKGIVGNINPADVAIQTYINNALNFLYLLAVVLALWGGFNILTAAGDEEKVKKGKTILIQAMIGIVVIFLADSIVNWVISSIMTPAS